MITTEHTHASAILPALKLGNHVYYEKPLIRDVHEARIITEAAAKVQVATQMSTQIYAGDNYRRVMDSSSPGTSAMFMSSTYGSRGPVGLANES
ncbi:MAG: hypothetical protein M2R45_05459 [Verrucomicrobia subdivision 3 bacterium]|nr:hypothetical protein [Limisphaerales bacterium]MCS1417880.1 hypothetical protein [Limisphaerales bacterium]